MANEEEAPTAADPRVEAPAPAPQQRKQEEEVRQQSQGEKEEAVSSVHGHLGPRSPPHLKASHRGTEATIPPLFYPVHVIFASDC